MTSAWSLFTILWKILWSHCSANAMLRSAYTIDRAINVLVKLLFRMLNLIVNKLHISYFPHHEIYGKVVGLSFPREPLKFIVNFRCIKNPSCEHPLFHCFRLRARKRKLQISFENMLRKKASECSRVLLLRSTFWQEIYYFNNFFFVCALGAGLLRQSRASPLREGEEKKNEKWSKFSYEEGKNISIDSLHVLIGWMLSRSVVTHRMLFGRNL